MHDLSADYESTQNFNGITRWLHSRRYRVSVSLIASIAHELGRTVRVFEIGCGQAKLFGELNRRMPVDYFGIDIEPAFVETARRRFGHLPNFRVEMRAAQTVDIPAFGERPDVVFALETFEHIAQQDVARVLNAIADLEPRCLICSVPVEVGPAVAVKNVGSWMMGYGRHLEYSWRETLAAACYQLQRLPPHSGGHKGFDWRWLAETISANFRHVERRHLPFHFLPASLAASMYFIAGPRPR